VALSIRSYRFTAFRSIFPAGTVSGAPKIRAIELVSALGRARRGAYAGAVGHFDFAPDSMDTCIAIRTMVFKDGVASLQAGGGIVFDSDEFEEYVETVNKLGANVRCIEEAEGAVPESYPPRVSFERESSQD
jgi:anthranilate synthase component 1